jgi:NDMA-dependent alcohol dehydrogenase
MDYTVWFHRSFRFDELLLHEAQTGYRPKSQGDPMRTRAAVLWDQPGEWKVQEIELDEPGPTEVLVEMAATGLCHSDDHFATGDAAAGHLPIIGGHEGSGIVRKVGALVDEFEVGDHVITAFIPACGKCKWCARGMQNLCDVGAGALLGAQPAGGFRAHADGSDVATTGALGTFAEWQVYDQLSLVKVDKSLPLHTICLVACGVQTGFGSATNAAGVRPGDVVLVLGAGGIGMNAVQGASLSGASHVIVVDPAPSKKIWAPQFGATEVFDNFEDADAFVKSVTNGQGADSAIVTIGVVKNEHIGQAYGAIRKAGTVVVAGVSSEREAGPIPGFNAMTVAMYQKRIQGALYGMGSPRDAMPELLNLYSAGRLKLDELITRRYTLDDINQAYTDLRAGVNIRGVIDFIPADASSALSARYCRHLRPGLPASCCHGKSYRVRLVAVLATAEDDYRAPAPEQWPHRIYA